MIGLGLGIGIGVNGSSSSGGIGLSGYYDPIPLLSNTRVGSRKTERPGYDYLVGANTVDSWQENGIWKVASMKGATNQIRTDIDVWSRNQTGGASVSAAIDRGDGIQEFTFFTGTGWGCVLQDVGTGITGNNGYQGIDYRVISGTSEVMSVKFANGNPFGQPDSFNTFIDDGEWHSLNLFPISSRNRVIIQARGPTEAGLINETVVVQFRNARFVDSEHYVSPFPDYSTTTQTYGSDLLTHAGATWTPEGEVAVGLDARYLIGSDKPEVDSRLWHAATGGAEMRTSSTVTNEWTYSNGSDVTISSALVEGSTQYLYSNWNGVDIAALANPGTSNTAADSSVPAGSLTIGNINSGVNPIHGVMNCFVFNHVLTAAERTLFEAL